MIIFNQALPNTLEAPIQFSYEDIDIIIRNSNEGFEVVATHIARIEGGRHYAYSYAEDDIIIKTVQVDEEAEAIQVQVTDNDLYALNELLEELGLTSNGGRFDPLS